MPSIRSHGAVVAVLMVVGHAALFVGLAAVTPRPVLYLAIGLAVGVHAHRLASARAELQSLVDVVRVTHERREALVDELERLSHTDPLTGLGNRRHLERELPRILVLAESTLSSVAVAMLDLDDFKAYNDAHGHLAGDRFLKEVAAAWQGHLRANDILVRLGGDEFVAVLPGCSLENAHRITGRLSEAAAATSSCSVGVASWDGREGPEQLLERADTAMYEAKRAGALARCPTRAS